MGIKAEIKKKIRKLDQFSPHPLFYPFVMSDSEKNIFDNAIRDAQYYLEFGLGGSTIRALQKSKATIYTVESSSEWIEFMRQYVAIRPQEGKRLHIFPVDIGPTAEWGFPVSDDFKDLYGSYSSSIFNSVNSNLIDLVLIDGRFRVACTLKTVLACLENRKTRILIHDFWDRPHYHVVLKYLDCRERADTIALFSIKEDIDLESLEKDYSEYKNIPE